MKRVLMMLFVVLIVMMNVPVKVSGEVEGNADGGVQVIEAVAPVDPVTDGSLAGEEGALPLVKGVFERVVGGFEVGAENPIYVTLFASKEFHMTEGQDHGICLGNTEGTLPLDVRSWRLVEWQEVQALQLELLAPGPGSYLADRVRIGDVWFAIGTLNIEVKGGVASLSLFPCMSGLVPERLTLEQAEGRYHIATSLITLTFTFAVTKDTQITSFRGMLPSYASEVLFTQVNLFDGDGILVHAVQYEGLVSEINLMVTNGQQIRVMYGMNDFAPHYLLQAIVVLGENQVERLGLSPFDS